MVRSSKLQAMEDSTSLEISPASDWSKQQQEHYRNQIRQIKQLTAHYITFDGSGMKEVAGSQSKDCADAVERKDSQLPSPCKCGLCCLNCQNLHSASTWARLTDGKTVKEFTPTRTCTSAKRSDNQGSNCHKGDAKSLDTISVINMPSQSQGQVCSPPPCKHHIRDITTRPLSSHLPATARSECQQQVTGWKRDVRSATIYTRYRTPELFSLIYSDLKSETVSSLDILSVHDEPGKKYTGLRYI